MESSFTDVEKRFILGEMVKTSHMDVGVLVDFIKSHDVQPDWLSMQLPGGRNMNQCLHAAEIMFNMPMPPPVISPLKRKSLGDLPDHFSKRQAVASPGDASPRGLSLGALQPAVGAHPVNIQPRPNGYGSAPLAPSPSVSAAPYNPAPTRRRGRPPKSVQNTWQVSTYPPISPAPIAPSPAPAIAPQPHSPGLRAAPAYQAAPQMPSDPKPKKKPLLEILPRPAQGTPGLEPAARSPIPGGEYQDRREETTRREYYQAQAAEPTAREPPMSSHLQNQILPRPRSPHPHPSSREPIARPALTDPAHFRETPPATPLEPVKNEGHTTTAAAAN
ncbi:hypothetical protein MFIFM68171_10443 [Madurella fahalii]|uniref:Uncharacterized protein n=1 Tax=Madurella fahalii TaxID=1157608 RepID=A0ABQ0GR72_9PEZI